MSKLAIVVLLAMAISVGGCVTSDGSQLRGFNFNNIEKIAIVEVKGDDLDESVKGIISDYFSLALLKKGYSPVALLQSETLLKSNNYDFSNLDSPKGITEAAQILDTPAILIVDVRNFNDKVSLDARLLSGDSGALIWMGSGKKSVSFAASLWPSKEQRERMERSDRLAAAKDIINKISENIPNKM